MYNNEMDLDEFQDLLDSNKPRSYVTQRDKQLRKQIIKERAKVQKLKTKYKEGELAKMQEDFEEVQLQYHYQNEQNRLAQQQNNEDVEDVYRQDSNKPAEQQ